MDRKLRAILLALVAALMLSIAACGDDDDDDGGGSGGGSDTAAEKQESIKAGVVTDIGGLNDRSFNALANAGIKRAADQLGVEERVLISKQQGDYIPNLTTLAQQQFDLIVPVGFLMADATNTVATKVPNANFAIVDFSATALKDKPKNVQGLLFKENEAGYLAGYLAGLWAKDNDAKVVSTVGGQKIPPVDALHRRLPGRRQEGQPGDPDAQRVLPGLRRPGEVQGDRARPDREGLEGRLPGGRRLRPRRARRGQGEGRAGHRRGRRPGIPRRPHPDQRSEEGRRGGVRSHQAGPGGPVRGRHRRGRDRRERRRRASARSARRVRSTPTRSRRSRIRSPRARSRTSPTRSSKR